LGKLAIFPGHVHLETASGAQAFYITACPSFWQGGKQDDLAFVRLHEHLANSCGYPEITVNLHRRTQAEEIGTGHFCPIKDLGIFGKLL
jgi:hypothetical protein